MNRPTTQHPTERYARDVRGMPCFAADVSLQVFITEENMKNAIPQDTENCAIALGCRNQLGSPYSDVGRHRVDLALPHPDGVTKPGFGRTKWAVHRYILPADGRQIVIDADTDDGKRLKGRGGALVWLIPPKASDRPGRKRERNKLFRQPKGVKDGRGKAKGNGQDRLTAMGVRTLTGQRKR